MPRLAITVLLLVATTFACVHATLSDDLQKTVNDTKHALDNLQSASSFLDDMTPQGVKDKLNATTKESGSSWEDLANQLGSLATEIANSTLGQEAQNATKQGVDAAKSAVGELANKTSNKPTNSASRPTAVVPAAMTVIASVVLMAGLGQLV